MIVQSIIAAILVVIGVIILEVNIKRLRLLIGGLSVIIPPLCFIPNDENDVSLELTITGIIVVLTIIVLVLANTWAKKK